MNAKRLLFNLILIGLFCQCNTSKEIQFKDGKCYAKCLVQHDPEGDYEEYAVYTGNELEEDVELEVKEIITQEKVNKWVKKKAEKNCLSPNPEDCMVWCLVDQPEKKEIFTLLVDTTQSKNYEIKRIYKNVNSDNANNTEWKEVLCEKDVTEVIVGQIQLTLKENNYYTGELNRKFDLKTKEALLEFQKDKKLPVGQLDLETLDVMGIAVATLKGKF